MGVIFLTSSEQTKNNIIKDKPNKELGHTGRSGRCTGFTAVKNNANSSYKNTQLHESYLFLYEKTLIKEICTLTSAKCVGFKYNDWPPFVTVQSG